MKTVRLEEAISKAKKLAEEKLARGKNADEFVEIGEADEFKLYITAGKTIKDETPISFHENPRDVFMLVLEGEIEFTFEKGEKTTVEAGECFVLPKHLKHHALSKKWQSQSKEYTRKDYNTAKTSLTLHRYRTGLSQITLIF